MNTRTVSLSLIILSVVLISAGCSPVPINSPDEPTAPPTEIPGDSEGEPVEGWVGLIVDLPPGHQLGQYFEREDGEEFDLGTPTDAVREQVAEAKSTGAQVKVWGTLHTGVPVDEARTIVLDRVELVSEQPADEGKPVEGWVGEIVDLPPGHQLGQYFEREDGEEFDLGTPTDAVREQVAEAKSTGAQVKVWGTLHTGVPVDEARTIVVERLEFVSEPPIDEDQPQNALVPPGPFTPPPPDFEPTPPPPPDPAADDPDLWVRDYVELVTAMLNSEESVQAVLDVLTTWAVPSEEARTEIEPFVWTESADLDGDGVAEWLMSLPLPGESYAPMWLRTYLVIFETDQDLFIPRSAIRGARPDAATAHQPSLRMIDDVTGDGQTEVLIEDTWCGAHTCFTGLTVGRWDGARWHDLADEPIYQASAVLTIEDRHGDGALEFIMHGGIIGSVGAGLQRPYTWVFAWEDGAYRLVEDIPDPSDHPYYLMLDANAALVEQDWDRALELASQVVSDPDFDELMAPIEEVDKRRIVSYAAVQAMLVHAQRDDVAAMEAVLDQALSHGFVEPNIYTEAAERLLDVYRETADPVQACSAMQDVVAERPDEAVFFQRYGYNTERITVDQICPLTPPTEDESPQL